MGSTNYRTAIRIYGEAVQVSRSGHKRATAASDTLICDVNHASSCTAQCSLWKGTGPSRGIYLQTTTQHRNSRISILERDSSLKL
jgi:hypothetical protein